MTGIYKITNPEGKVYIGKSKNIPKRWRMYASLKAMGQPKLHESFKQFGYENHKFEIVELCDSSILSERERHYIDLYLCYETGLNKSTAFKVMLNVTP